MENFYNKNGLVFWTEEEILVRDNMEKYFTKMLHSNLLKLNQAFKMYRIEAPEEFINKNYLAEDVYKFDDLVLRPETTAGSYEYAKYLLQNHHEGFKINPPIVVWQHGKSFRREQDQPTKFMRLKEFYQLEYQIIYSKSTANDYSIKLIPEVCKMISDMISECHIEDSDRLPDYSEKTVDVVCDKSGMEVCSISKRNDLEGYNVLEVAIGTDRCVYNFFLKNNFKSIDIKQNFS